MIKKRIVFLIAIVSLIYITFATLNVKAHNPASVNLSYNSNSEVLIVTIVHETSNPSSHYINSVYITVNGNMVVDELYTSQPQNTFVYMYYFTANECDRIQVTANCNVGGDNTEYIIVGNGSCVQTIDIPGYYGIMLIIAISAIILSMITFKNIKKRLR